jgi:two-component sensor histidine kinase
MNNLPPGCTQNMIDRELDDKEPMSTWDGRDYMSELKAELMRLKEAEAA